MSAIDSFIREVECFDGKWFAEIGGPAARTEVNALRTEVDALRKSAQQIARADASGVPDLDPTLENIGISRIEELWENG